MKVTLVNTDAEGTEKTKVFMNVHRILIYGLLSMANHRLLINSN